jgi:hypothetical protein
VTTTLFVIGIRHLLVLLGVGSLVDAQELQEPGTLGVELARQALEALAQADDQLRVL